MVGHRSFTGPQVHALLLIFSTAEFRVQRWILHAVRYHDNEHSVSHIAILYFNLT